MGALLDELDRRLVGALHVAPRASWDDLASVLAVDASTISRRYSRLHDDRVVRVVGQVDWQMYSSALPVHLFVDTASSTPHAVIDRLRKIPQVQYLAQTSGTSSVFTTVHAACEAATREVLDRVYATAGVSAVTALPVLRAAGRGAGWEPQLLTGAERRRSRNLGIGEQAASPPRVGGLDEVERALVSMLQQDGRASAASLGRAAGLATSTAHRLVRRLLAEGWVRPRVEIEPARLGFATPFVLRLRVRPGATPAVLTALTALPQTRYTTQVAGAVAIVCTGLVTDTYELADFVDHRLADIDDITTVEVDIVLAERRRYWLDRDPATGLGRFNPPPLL